MGEIRTPTRNIVETHALCVVLVFCGTGNREGGGGGAQRSTGRATGKDRPRETHIITAWDCGGVI